MFRGIAHFNLGADGRVTLLRAWQADFPDAEAVISRFYGCWRIYPTAEWARWLDWFTEKVGFHPDPGVRRPARMIIGHAETLAVGKQGEVTIPASVLDAMRPPCPAVLMGVGQHLELWRHDDWEKAFVAPIDDLLPEIQRYLDGA